MERQSESAGGLAGFRGRMLWTALASLVVAALAVVMLALTGTVTFALAFTVFIGTLVAFFLGAGLMTTMYASEKAGYDDDAAYTEIEGPLDLQGRGE